MPKLASSRVHPVDPGPASASIQIVYRSLRELEPFAGNARTHSTRQIDKLRASLARFGWTNPMLIAGARIIAGHARLRAAIAMAEAAQPIPRNDDPWMGPTVDLSHLTEAERRAYVIADNRLAEDGGWDNDLLRFEMTDLKAMDFDLGLTGFLTKEIDAIIGNARPAASGMSESVIYQLVLDCRDELHQAELLERFRAEGLSCKPLML